VIALIPVLLAILYAADVSAQVQVVETLPDARLVDVGTDPEEVRVGDPFTLFLTIRLRPGREGAPGLTLSPSAHAEGIGPGEWTTSEAPGDSTDLLASYPAIAFREGVIELPRLLLEFETVPDGGSATWRTMEAPALETSGLMFRIGGVQATSVLDEDAEARIAPRPPAGVIGVDRSPWHQAGGAVLMAGILLALAGGAFWARALFPGSGRPRWKLPSSPREEALRELDRILAEGAHTRGDPVTFYEASTGVARRFAGTGEPAWGADLTAGELLEKMSERWTAERMGELAQALRAGEEVKFGHSRPKPERAETDWRRIYAWIQGQKDPS
jgi:hypothetical protein